VISDGLGIWLVGIVPHSIRGSGAYWHPGKESLLRVHYPHLETP
jgi:hypothetical protein